MTKKKMSAQGGSASGGKRGKFIVIDGTDGSGKKTQTDLLVKRLKKEKYKVKVFDFPQYGKKSAGLVEEYLNGRYGTAQEVGPYRASLFYACDRYDASFEIKKFIKKGYVVISNRYVTANMGHQGGKIKDAKKRNKFFDWLYELEYKIFEIPKPDLNIVLHVDAAVAQKLIDGKATRAYIKGKKKRDLHEKDIKHLRDAEKVYLEIAKTMKNFKLISCTKDKIIMTRGEISELVWKSVKKLLK